MSSGFITEAEIEERKRIRQQEWEKVRQPDEPIQAPPEVVDNRSLFDRLQEQKNKKQEEFEEAHKLKNLVKRLDDDEVQFLDQVDQERIEEERRKRLAEAKELNDFRNAVTQLKETELKNAIFQEIGLMEKPSKPKQAPTDTKRTSQSQLLSSVIKRKPATLLSQEEPLAKKSKDDEGTSLQKVKDADEKKQESSSDTIPSVPYKGNLVCIGVLPGLSSYANSDDEEDNDSDSDIECDSHSHSHTNCGKNTVRDLCGRKIEYEPKKENN